MRIAPATEYSVEGVALDLGFTKNETFRDIRRLNSKLLRDECPYPSTARLFLDSAGSRAAETVSKSRSGSSLLREERTGRGPRREESYAPLLPDPLLHSMAEREKN